MLDTTKVVDYHKDNKHSKNWQIITLKETKAFTDIVKISPMIFKTRQCDKLGDMQILY